MNPEFCLIAKYTRNLANVLVLYFHSSIHHFKMAPLPFKMAVVVSEIVVGSIVVGDVVSGGGVIIV